MSSRPESIDARDVAAQHLTAGEYVGLAIAQISSGAVPSSLPGRESTLVTSSIEPYGGAGFTHICNFIDQSGGHAMVHNEPDAKTLNLYLPRFDDRASGDVGTRCHNGRRDGRTAAEHAESS